MGKVAEGRDAAEEAAPATGPGATFVPGAFPARVPHAERRAALGENACDIAGICDAIDRDCHKAEDGPAKADNKGRGVIDEDGGDINSEGLHFAGLQGI